MPKMGLKHKNTRRLTWSTLKKTFLNNKYTRKGSIGVDKSVYLSAQQIYYVIQENFTNFGPKLSHKELPTLFEENSRKTPHKDVSCQL